MIPFFYLFYRFGRSVWVSLKDPEFKALFTLLVIVLCTGTVFYHYNESWSWLDSFYFSVTTLTTLGDSDLSPNTAASKIFTIAYLLVGIGILLGFINFVAQTAVNEQKKNGILPWRSKSNGSSSL